MSITPKIHRNYLSEGNYLDEINMSMKIQVGKY